MALDVGKIFYSDKNVVAYSKLGIGRLIYQLPQNLCRIFIKEIYGDTKPEDIDEEILTTVNKFLENNLNEDGSVNIPVALRPYMGGKDKIG